MGHINLPPKIGAAVQPVGLWDDALEIVIKNLIRRSDALLGPALHVALKVGRTVFASEMDAPLPRPFVPAESGVLADLPERVGPAQVWVVLLRTQGRRAGIVFRYAREDRFDFVEKCFGIGANGWRGCRWRRSRRCSPGPGRQG